MNKLLIAILACLGIKTESYSAIGSHVVQSLDFFLVEVNARDLFVAYDKLNDCLHW